MHVHMYMHTIYTHSSGSCRGSEGWAAPYQGEHMGILCQQVCQQLAHRDGHVTGWRDTQESVQKLSRPGEQLVH